MKFVKIIETSFFEGGLDNGISGCPETRSLTSIVSNKNYRTKHNEKITSDANTKRLYVLNYSVLFSHLSFFKQKILMLIYLLLTQMGAQKWWIALVWSILCLCCVLQTYSSSLLYFWIKSNCRSLLLCYVTLLGFR